MRTQKQIDKEIKVLESLKGNIVAFSFFGDDNNARVQVQIDVLKDEMDKDATYDLWGTDGKEENESLFECATLACDWLHEDCDELPSDDWKNLRLKKS